MATAALVAPSAAAGKSCVETSDVIGEQKCSRYGHGWSSEGSLPLTLELGLRRTTFGLPGRDFSARFTKKGPVAYGFDGGSAGAEVNTYGFSLRSVGMLGTFAYIGYEQAFVFGHLDGTPFEAGGRSVVAGSGLNAVAASFGVPIGFRLPLGKVSLRGETFLGLTVLGLTQDVGGKRANASWVGGAIESRGYLDFWLANDTTLSLMVGHDLLRRNDRISGLVLTYHGRAYDGRYGF